MLAFPMVQKRNPFSPSPRTAAANPQQGVIAAVYTDKYLVREKDQEWLCTQRGTSRKGIRPVVGDVVRFEITERGDAAITALQPRRSSLVRRTAHRGRGGQTPKAQVLAANVDLLIIVAALKAPPFRAGLVERMLVAGAIAGIEALLCIHKSDQGSPQQLEELAQPYRALDIPVLDTTITDPSSLVPLKHALRDLTGVLVGHSGVGKTSLLNALCQESFAVGAVLPGKGLGRHTTSTARLLPLVEGGNLIDSPGVREFGLYGISRTELAQYYPDFRPLLGQCGFGDCLHRSEPACAIQQAAQNGTLSPARLASYLYLLDELP